MRDGAFFVKLVDGTAAHDLVRDPNAFALVSLIALRAYKGRGVNMRGLRFGEAFLGDHRECGLSRGQYRTAQRRLKSWGLVDFRGTSKGTIARLCGAEVYDIGRSPEGQQKANEVPPESQRRTTKSDLRGKNTDSESEIESDSAVSDSPASQPSEVIEEGLSQELCARWRPAFDTLKATGKLPALRMEHLVNADRAHPGARLADSQSYREAAADARGVIGVIGDTAAWLRRRASGIEMRRLGIGRQALPGAGRGVRDRGRRDLGAGLPREWGGSVAGAVPAAKSEPADAGKGSAS